MNLDLEERLTRENISYERLNKATKVKLLTRWSKIFPNLIASARHSDVCEDVYRDKNADEPYAGLPACDFYILPDDDSGMTACICFAANPPELSELVSDMFTKCDELVLVDKDFRWSAVFVNHGGTTVGKHFRMRPL